MRNFTPSEERAEIERLAKLMCRALNAFDPDTLIVRDEPKRFLDGYALDLSYAQPAWCRYLHAAKIVFDDARNREYEEAARANDVDPDGI